MPSDASKSTAFVPLPEIKIFSNRLLYADTTEKILNRLDELEHITNITLHGETLPTVCKLGPSTGTPVKHPQRKTIKIGGREEELTIMVGTIFLEVDDFENVDPVLEKVQVICDEILVHGYSLEVGRYSRYRPTVSDYLKGLR